MRLDRVAQHVEVIAIVSVGLVLLILYIVSRILSLAHG
jgi:hypothetical protein